MARATAVKGPLAAPGSNVLNNDWDNRESGGGTLVALWERHRALERLLDYRFASAEKALALQGAEYARRLDELNHARAEAKHVLTTYAPRDIVDGAVAAVEGRLRALELWQSGRHGSLEHSARGQTTFVAIAGLVISVIVAIVLVARVVLHT